MVDSSVRNVRNLDVIEKNLVRRYAILKILSKNGFMTRYSLFVNLQKLGLRDRHQAIYYEMDYLESNGIVGSKEVRVPTKKCGYKRGWWKQRERPKLFFFLTESGNQVLSSLEAKITMILNGDVK